MVGFYKHDIPAWMDGTEALSDAAYRAYHVVVQLIMLNEGPITRNDRGIAGRCNQTLKTFQKAFDELVAAGKLALVGGKISNERADRELQFVMKNRENAGKGGKTRADREKARENNENAPANSLINNDVVQAPLESLSSLKEKRREEKKDLLSEGASDDTGKDLELDLIEPQEPEEKSSGKRKRIAYPEAFEALWAAYPTDANMSKQEALKVWQKLDEADRSLLMASVAPFKAWVAKQVDYRVVHLERYIKWRRFEGFAAKAAPPASSAAAPATEPHPYAGWSDDRWREEVRMWRGRCGDWPWKKSAPPDDPRTAVPRHILAEMNIHPARARAA